MNAEEFYLTTENQYGGFDLTVYAENGQITLEATVSAKNLPYELEALHAVGAKPLALDMLRPLI